MVALSEMTNTFWGVTLDGDGKRYTQVVERSFHISMAALETSGKKVNDKAGPYVGVMIQHEKTEFLLCTLQHGCILQQPLDLNFNEGEEVTFFLNGKGVVHLTGYLVEDNLPDDMAYGEEMTSSEEGEEESEDNSSEEGSRQLVKHGVTAMESDDENEDEDEDEASRKAGKRKKKDISNKKIAKKAKIEQPSDSEDDDDDGDDDDDDIDEADLDSDDSNFLDDEAEETSDMDDEDDEDVSEDEEEMIRMSGSFLQTKSKGGKNKQSVKETLKTAGKKQDNDTSGNQKQTPGAAQEGKLKPGGQKQTPGAQKKELESKATPMTSDQDRSDTSTEKKKKKKKKKKNQPGSEQATPVNNQSQSKTSTLATGLKQTPGGTTPGSNQKPRGQKRVLEGGVICEELKEGHGPTAVPGKMVQVYYTGKLENGKIFDSATGGKPFKFKLGKNEVIKGWDIGLKGMKVGGKRKLIVPAKMAYGKEKVGNIPPNSTLVFDVELKAVS